MFIQKPVPVPPPSPERFTNAIAHPDLWLWDSWTAETDDGTTHLYCLALSRKQEDGRPVSPADRNDYPFHIRHFTSTGDGWTDRGAFLTPENIGDGAYARNVWSGSMLARPGNDMICGFTGLRRMEGLKPFLQTICLGRSRYGDSLDTSPTSPLSCPLRDYDLIREAGYYLPEKSSLGAHDGEEGGPILAWRDPFILDAEDNRLELFWAAKVAPARGAVAQASVVEHDGEFRLEKLHPPMTLPDDRHFTQAEMPKMHFDSEQGFYYLLISACDRYSETQPAEEVSKVLRLYRAPSCRGPWQGAFAGGESLVRDTEHLFGASVLDADFAAGRLKLIAPYTEYASDALQLTFAPPRLVDLPRVGAVGAATPL